MSHGANSNPAPSAPALPRQPLENRIQYCIRSAGKALNLQPLGVDVAMAYNRQHPPPAPNPNGQHPGAQQPVPIGEAGVRLVTVPPGPGLDLLAHVSCQKAGPSEAHCSFCPKAKHPLVSDYPVIGHQDWKVDFGLGPYAGITVPEDYKSKEAQVDLIAIAWIRFGKDTFSRPVLIYGKRPAIFGLWDPKDKIWIGVPNVVFTQPAVMKHVIPLNTEPTTEFLLPSIPYDQFVANVSGYNANVYYPEYDKMFKEQQERLRAQRRAAHN